MDSELRPSFVRGISVLGVLLVSIAALCGMVYGVWSLGVLYLFDVFFYFGPVMVYQMLTISCLAALVGGVLVGPFWIMDRSLTKIVPRVRPTPTHKYGKVWREIAGWFFFVQILANLCMSVKLFPLARQFEQGGSCEDYEVHLSPSAREAFEQMNETLKEYRFIRIGDWYVKYPDSYHGCDKRAWAVYLFRGF